MTPAQLDVLFGEHFREPTTGTGADLMALAGG